jgi:membrane-bound lytic murein transglycosylase
MQEANQKELVAAQMKKAASSATATHSDKMIALSYAASVDDDLLAATIGVQAENQERENRDMKTATLLGYDSWWVAVNGAMDGSSMGRRKADMRAELEEDRYFVVLTAFDYQTLVSKKKTKFLWEVRFSIREHGTAFDDRLAGMVAKASDYFGRDSGGLRHVDLPEGKVEIGPVKSLGVVTAK